MIRRSVNNLKLKQNEEEALYFKTEFRDPATVFNYPVLCTVCKKSITDDILRRNQLQSHPILGVVICRSCIQFYGDGNFSVDEDGSDKYCRWCGQGGMLNCCSVCTVAFCKSCLKKNLSRKYLNDIEKDDWRCLICNPEPLMHLRAICYAANEYVKGLRRKKKKRKYRQAFDELNSNNSTTISNRKEVPKRTVVCNQDLTDKQSTSKENVCTEKPIALSKEICSLDNNTNKEDDLFPTLGLIKNYANYSLKQKRSIRDLVMNTMKDLNKLSEMVIVKSEAFRKKYLEDESAFNENISSVVEDAQSILKDSICNTQRLYEALIDDLDMRQDVKKETDMPSPPLDSKKQAVTSTPLENCSSPLNCSKFKNEDVNSVRLSQINGECNEPEDPQEKYIKYLLNINNLKRPCTTDSENDEEDDNYRLLSKKVKSEQLEEKNSTEISDDEKCNDPHVESVDTEKLSEKQDNSLEDNINRYFRDMLLNSESDVEQDSDTSTVVELTSASEPETKSEEKPTNDEINDNAIEINFSDENQLVEATDTKDISNFESNGNQNIENIQDKSDESDSLCSTIRKRNKDPLMNSKLLLSSSSDEETLIPTKNSTPVLGDSNKENNSGNDSDIVSRIKPSKRTKLKYLSDSSDSDFYNSKLDSPNSSTSSSNSSSKKSGTNNGSSTGLKRRRTRIVRISGTSESETENLKASQTSAGSGKSTRKSIRKLLGDDELAEETKRTAKLEAERLKRIQERQKLYNESFNIFPTENNVIENLVLDFDEETKETLVSVDPGLIKKLKPHQAQGVKFMWDSTFESIKEINKPDSGSGCILAHCMGLGKTLQVVTLVHTILTHENTKVKTVLVVCPLSIVLNWVQEFNSWLSDVNSGDDVNVYHLARKMSNSQRTYYLDTWRKNGGVCIMGYDMYRILINIGNRIKPNLKEMLHEAILDPGPDLVICDEGHMLKNEKTATTKAINKIKTNRRIVLTGTPIQNNLKEYFHMVQFVKPNLLGDKKEFNNRFVHPIVNGQFVDSTIHDVRLMKRRAHVLHKKLDGIVQRLDYNVLTPFLPPKYEYVLQIRLTKIQADLYEHYLNNYCRIMGSNTLFQNYQMFRLIWTHPYVLKLSEERKQTETTESSDEEGSLKDFVVHDDTTSVTSSTSSSVKYVSDDDSIKSIPITFPSNKNKTSDDDEIKVENLPKGTENGNWWSQFVTDEQAEVIENGSKLIFLFSILEKCQMIGDKVLIFSQSLLTLDMIEHFLQKLDGNWILGLDYFRLDGSTSTILRASFCDKFNDKDNYRARVFLISTRAGGLGINLTAANRVIILDASWNPSHDVQSIFRVFRFGQVKPCYIYRIIAKGTMEEKIYERQVTKQSVSCRVVDEQQIDRHFNSADLNELYMFCKEPPIPTETPKLPVDRLMAELLMEHKNIVCSYHEHDSLLQNIADEELTEEERKQAWEDYEMENRAMDLPVTMNTNAGIYGYGMAHVMNIPSGTSDMNFGSFRNIKIPDFETILQTVTSQHPKVAYPVVVKMVKTVIEQIAKFCNDRNFLEHEILQKNNLLSDEEKYLETVRLNNNRTRVNLEINELRKRLITYSSKFASAANV